MFLTLTCHRLRLCACNRRLLVQESALVSVAAAAFSVEVAAQLLLVDVLGVVEKRAIVTLIALAYEIRNTASRFSNLTLKDGL